MVGVLPSPVNLNQTRKVLAALRVAIHTRHHGFLSFEDTDAIPQHLQHNAILFPLFQDLNVERFGTRIEIRP